MYREQQSRLVPGAVVWQLTDAGEHRVLPDGCTDFLWDGHSLRVAGPDTTAFLTTTMAGTVTGLRFAPGWGPAIYGVPAHALRDQRVPLDALWSAREVTDLVERLHTSARPGAMLESIAHARLEQSGVAAPTDLDAIVLALRAGQRVSAVAHAFGFSARQLQRRSVTAFGYGPKMLARILRLERALDLARAGHDIAYVAVRTGYADQSHFANDTRALAGVSITRLLAA